MKKSKHMKPKENKAPKKKISANHFDEPLAVIEYEDDTKPRLSAEETVKIPKAVYRVGLILTVAVLILAVWMNRDNLRPENIKVWFTYQLKGEEVIEGFPVAVTGNQVKNGNFLPSLGNCAVLSDTAFTVLSAKGGQVSYARHSFSNPALKTAGGYHLIYNIGLQGYLLNSGDDTLLEKDAGSKIYFGDVAPNGTFVLGLQGEEYASELQVHKKNGDMAARYWFAGGYANAAAISSTGTMGAVNTLNSAEGNLFSKVTVLDFGKKDPVFEYTLTNNMVLDLFWLDSGNVFAVGDRSAAILSSKQSEQQEFSFDSQQVTAYTAGSGKLFVALSGYEYGGSGRIAIIDSDQKEMQTIELEQRVLSLSSYGSTLAVLTGGIIHFYDSTTLKELGTADCGNDARAIALENESTVYVLGASEIRKMNADKA